jgi:hypothetical protein
VVKKLVKYNADIETKDNSGWTPLIWGIFINNEINLNYLLFLYYSYLQLLGRATLKWLENY